jgi:hypothetical protein
MARRIIWPVWESDAVQSLNYGALTFFGFILSRPQFEVFGSATTFQWLQEVVGSAEDEIGYVLILLGLVSHIALWFKWYIGQRIGIALAGCVWTMAAGTFWAGNPHGVAWSVYTVLSLSCLWAAGRLASERLAMQVLVTNRTTDEPRDHE